MVNIVLTLSIPTILTIYIKVSVKEISDGNFKEIPESTPIPGKTPSLLPSNRSCIPKQIPTTQPFNTLFSLIKISNRFSRITVIAAANFPSPGKIRSAGEVRWMYSEITSTESFCPEFSVNAFLTEFKLFKPKSRIIVLNINQRYHNWFL